jgi:murein DD-endopeptidase MepM/ murein hydrolase activator NlpD
VTTTSFTDNDIGPDGIARNKTKIKVVVHSHNQQLPIDVSNAVIRFSTNKTTKAVGSMQLTLVADRNYLNLINPNDYINLYIDRKDNQGFVRTFFGFVDAIEENWTTSGDGKPTTVYLLTCSDWQKALDKTNIYFNPQVALREDFTGGFIGTPNIGGAALRTRGVRTNGSPADVITNMMILLLGFGSQFTLPASYNPRLASRLRQQRADFVLGRLSEDVRNQVTDIPSYAAFLERVRQDLGIESSVDSLTTPDSVAPADATREDRTRYGTEVARLLGGNGSSIGVESERSNLERGEMAYSILNSTLSGYPPSLLDIIDIFTFVERQTIDGYFSGLSIWEFQGSLLSFLMQYSNEVVNELIFDLRPISKDGGLEIGPDFSRDPDDLSGNEESTSDVAGIQYAPAVIMREYPFSTIDYIDGSNIRLTVSDGDNPTTLGRVQVGAIFSDQPNQPGRHVIEVPNINPEDLRNGEATANAKKHIDVAVVRNKDIISTRFARSDQEHFNLFEILSESTLGEDSRFFMQDMLPIISPIHIARHGLRTRRAQTQYARFPLDMVSRINPVPETPVEEEETPAEPTPEARRDVYLPVDLMRVDGGDYSQGYVTRANQWWYRPKEFDGHRHINNADRNPVPADGVPYWRFHNGVDVFGRRGTPVKAVRDGVIVGTVPDGTAGYGGYGNIVLMYHEQDEFYTLYAHLEGFREDLTPTSRARWAAPFVSSRINPNGTLQETAVRAGDVIGYLGNTGAGSDGPHLHFEVDVPRRGRVYPTSLDRDNGLTPDYFSDPSSATPGFPVSVTKPPNPSEEETRSQDPIRVFREKFGIDWPVQAGLNLDGGDVINPITGEVIGDEPVSGDSAEISDEYPDDGAESTPTEDLEAAPLAEEEEPETVLGEEVTSSSVDNWLTRIQLARWSLLNDHWFQHNLEYLSGSVEMRGSPEIRVGYRLDLEDRNLSFYVEGVTHNWTYGQPMTTTVLVTRGQPSNPYPGYVLPATTGFDPTETQRRLGSRLGEYFVTSDPTTIRRSTRILPNSDTSIPTLLEPASERVSRNYNIVDTPEDETHTLSDKYSENIIESVSVTSADVWLEAAAAGERAPSTADSTASTDNTTAVPSGTLTSEARTYLDSTGEEVA